MNKGYYAIITADVRYDVRLTPLVLTCIGGYGIIRAQ